jgi:hypothetical protein
MADPLGKDPGETGKRPKHTIEGTATEISVAPSSENADEPSGADEADSEAPAAPEPERKVPGSRTSRIELKGFITHLAAGTLGALIGILALALGWKLIPERTALDLSPIEKRLADIEARPVPDSSEAIAALGTRLKELEQRPAETPAELTDLSVRVQKLEESLQALAKSAEAGAPVGNAAALENRLGEVERRLDSKIESALGAQQTDNAKTVQTLEGEIASLTERLGALAEANKTADQATQGVETDIEARLAKLEQEVPNLADSVAKNAQSAKAGAAALAFTKLSEVVRSGRPFAVELAAFKAVAPNAQAVDAIAVHAASGIPTLEQLRGSFDEAVEKSEMPAKPGDGSLLGSVIESARSAVRIRRVDAAETDAGPDAAIAKAEKHLAKGEISTAIENVGSLPAPAREAFAPWLDQARARLTANETLAALEAEIVPALGASGDPAPNP